MKNIIKLFLKKVSRLIYYIIPDEIQYKIYRKSKLELKLENELSEETYDYFKKHFENSLLFKDVLKIREYAIQKSLLNDKNKEYYYLEFGVYKGESANYFSKYVKKLYAFDSFEGLREDWVGRNKRRGDFNLNKQIPKLNSNVETIFGWVEDTLEYFLKQHNQKINFVHLDMDTYSPTKFTLEKLKPYLVKNAILIFDELYHYYGWQNGEFKALNEVFKEDEFEYKAFNLKGNECVIQLK